MIALHPFIRTHEILLRAFTSFQGLGSVHNTETYFFRARNEKKKHQTMVIKHRKGLSSVRAETTDRADLLQFSGFRKTKWLCTVLTALASRTHARVAI